MRKILTLLLCLAASWVAGSAVTGEPKRAAQSATARQLARAGYVDVTDADPTLQVSRLYARAANLTGRLPYAAFRAAFL